MVGIYIFFLLAMTEMAVFTWLVLKRLKHFATVLLQQAVDTAFQNAANNLLAAKKLAEETEAQVKELKRKLEEAEAGIRMALTQNDLKQDETLTVVLKSLEAEHEKTRRIVTNNSEDAIITKDLNGVITAWNAGAEKLFGYTAEETIGRSITMLIPPDRLDEEPKILSQLRLGLEIANLETIRIAKDGSRLNLTLSISPIRDADGHVVGAAKHIKVPDAGTVDAAVLNLVKEKIDDIQSKK